MKQLSPTERALIQLAESILLSACIAGLISVEPLIAGTGPIDWQVVLTSFGLAVAFSVAHSVAAYFKPAQPDLSAAISAIVDELESRVQTVPQNRPTVSIAQPLATGYPNVSMNASPAPMPLVGPNSGNVWAPPNVSNLPTASVPVPPKQ